MFVLPLGLQAKTRDFPWTTLAILFVTVVYSVSRFALFRQPATASGLLTPETFELWPLVRAQFLHGGWSHLLGNMLFFLIFAIPLEQRLGGLTTTIVYFVGGSLGLALEVVLFRGASTPIVGASANISALAGLFLVMFRTQQLRVLVSLFFVSNRVMMVPAWFFLAAFVLVQDVSALLNPATDGVAHWAHLGGFMTGVVAGVFALPRRKLPSGFVFPFEVALYHRAVATGTTLETRFALLSEILFHNSMNQAARLEGWRLVISAPDTSWEALPREAKVFLVRQFSDLVICLNSTDENDGSVATRVLREAGAQASWPWTKLLPATSLTRLMGTSKELERKGRAEEARLIIELLNKTEGLAHGAQRREQAA